MENVILTRHNRFMTETIAKFQHPDLVIIREILPKTFIVILILLNREYYLVTRRTRHQLRTFKDLETAFNYLNTYFSPEINIKLESIVDKKSKNI